MKPKIYLSKSKAGNFDDIVKVKTLLGKYDCEILEFQGGIYSTDKLLASEILIIVPPKKDKIYSDSWYIGKGQYTELDVFYTKYPCSPILIWDGYSFYDLSRFTDDDSDDEKLRINWQDHWGNVIGRNKMDNSEFSECLDLKLKQEIKSESIIKTISKEKEEISVTIKTNINLLICS